MSTTLSKGSQKTRRKAGKVKLSFSQKKNTFQRDYEFTPLEAEKFGSEEDKGLKFFRWGDTCIFHIQQQGARIQNPRYTNTFGILDGLILFDLLTNIVRESKEGTNSLTH